MTIDPITLEIVRGGLGNPYHRPVEQVQWDVVKGFVSLEGVTSRSSINSDILLNW